MYIAGGEWSIVNGGTQLLGLAYSLFFDTVPRTASCALVVKPVGHPKRHLSLLGLSVHCLRREERGSVVFEPVVRTWDRQRVDERPVVGRIYPSSGSGSLHIGDVLLRR